MGESSYTLGIKSLLFFDFCPRTTCYILACMCILKAFGLLTNVGLDFWPMYIITIISFGLLLLAGILLLLGTLWGNECMKLSYCWLLYFDLVLEIAGLVVYFVFAKDIFVVYAVLENKMDMIMVGLNTAVVILWDIYTPLVVLDKWEEIIKKFDKNRFLPWVWPEKKNLEFIGKCVRSQNTNTLISVGCGSGLLEWLLEAATGVEVTGVEIDGNWWRSRYSSGSFIPTVLVEDSKKGEFGVETDNSVLLFCYFNNLEAFLNYINHFKGNCFIVIGPGRGRGTYTIPEPFQLPEGIQQNWKLSSHQEIRSSKDFIAVYVRK